MTPNTLFRAIVRDVFILPGRGCVIVLENGFSGAARVGQAVRLGAQTVRVAAVEFVDTASESWVAIVVGEEYFALAKTHVGKEILEPLALLSPSEMAIIKGALQAAVEGGFFPDWEFQTLMGVDRETMRKVYEAWPQQTVGEEDFVCAVFNSMTMLNGYPHGKDKELTAYVHEGRAAIAKVLNRVKEIEEMIARDINGR